MNFFENIVVAYSEMFSHMYAVITNGAFVSFCCICFWLVILVMYKWNWNKNYWIYINQIFEVIALTFLVFGFISLIFWTFKSFF